MTPEEFDAVTDYDDRFVYELIHGVLIVSPFPGESERDPNEELGFLLRTYQYQHPQGTALDKTLTEQYIALPDSRRRADRMIWVGLGRVPNPQKHVPSIVVEFVSRRKRDRVRDYEEKRRDYQAIGIAEYWIIDRFEKTMTVFKFALAKNPRSSSRRRKRIGPRSCPASSSLWRSCSKLPTIGPAKSREPKATRSPKTHAVMTGLSTGPQINQE